MNTFFSILYCPIRPTSDERLSIALFLKDGDTTYFRYSHDKLKIIRELIPESAYRLLKGNLNSFESFFGKGIYGTNETIGLGFDAKIELPGNLSKASYFDYLNKYSNNLIHFSTPKPISVSIDDEVFKKLYTKFVFDPDHKIHRQLSYSDKVHRKVDAKIMEHVNLNIKLTSKEVEHLAVPTPVWFIGKNEVEVTGQVFDFDKRLHDLEGDLSKHINLVRSLDETSKHTGTHFIVGKEPKNTDSTRYSIWNEIRKLKFFKYVPDFKTDEIPEYMNQHGVTPFLEQWEINSSEEEENDLPF